MVSKNVTSSLATYSKRKSHVGKVSHRPLLTGVVAKRTASSRLITMNEKILNTLRNFLLKYKQFRIQLDQNNEVAWMATCHWFTF